MEYAGPSTADPYDVPVQAAEPDVELAHRLTAERDQMRELAQMNRGDAERHAMAADRFQRMADSLDAALSVLLPQKPVMAAGNAQFAQQDGVIR